ncbi:hypothetical protein BRADI_1g13485v3 [Brachypodium distachyon]|uniref:Reverse transcriptase zinc-binding domain-containing protein n=1 Tax=Brachypodium distachyon TaxID=15368 RepID=A0A2K2DJC0_BRADI|nr:hypothetical protein BRADI_1g13485v3 [Brachypodium distachyon]
MAMKKEYGGLGIPNLRDLNAGFTPCDDRLRSTFWKGVMWAGKAAIIGYHWVIGNGRNVRFWEDQWFGGSSLAIQFWDLYIICNEQMAPVSEVWTIMKLGCPFWRTFWPRLIEQWGLLSQILSSIELTDEQDQMMWKLNNSGIYSSQSLYAVVNFREILYNLNLSLTYSLTVW